MRFLDWLLEPKLFNYLILMLYGLNIARWAWAGSWADAWYWLSAASITSAITWGYKH